MDPMCSKTGLSVTELARLVYNSRTGKPCEINGRNIRDVYHEGGIDEAVFNLAFNRAMRRIANEARYCNVANKRKGKP